MSQNLFPTVDGSIVFGPLASTRMACDGVDTWLQHASTAVITGDLMEIFDDGGAPIGELHRAGG